MKRILLLAVFFALPFSAQEQQPEKMNIVKTNVTAYAFRNVNLTYERIINQKFSVSAGYGTVIKGSIPFSSNFIKDTNVTETDVSLSHFTLEPRIYFGRGFGRGFYLAPYYRHSSFTVDNIVFNVNFSTGKVPLSLKGKGSANSGGLLLGAQWFLGKKENWVLDAWMLGAHFGKSSGELRGTSSRVLTPAEQAELKETIDGQDIPFVKYTTVTDANGATLLLDGQWIGVRAGVSLGYRF